MGRRGLRELAARNVELAHRGADRRSKAAGIPRRFSGQFFNEFVVAVRNPEATLAACERHGVLRGTGARLATIRKLATEFLISVTEMNTPGEIDLLRDVLAGGR